MWKPKPWNELHRNSFISWTRREIPDRISRVAAVEGIIGTLFVCLSQTLSCVMLQMTKSNYTTFKKIMSYTYTHTHEHTNTHLQSLTKAHSNPIPIRIPISMCIPLWLWLSPVTLSIQGKGIDMEKRDKEKWWTDKQTLLYLKVTFV